MTGNEKLRKENQSLQNEIAELKEKLQKISEEFSSKKAELTKPDAEKKMSSECAHSLEFVSSKYDDLVAFKDEALKQIKQLFTVDEFIFHQIEIKRGVNRIQITTKHPIVIFYLFIYLFTD